MHVTTTRHVAKGTPVDLNASSIHLDSKDFDFLHLPEPAPPFVSSTHTHVLGDDWGTFATTFGIPSSVPSSTSSIAPPITTVTSTSISNAKVKSTAEGNDICHKDTIEANGEATAYPVSSKRNGWTRRLVVTKQPASEFYKDEGGKSNALEVEVTLVEFNEHGEPARSSDEEFIDIPLRILLFFESGKRVDDTDQEIFRFVGNEYDSVVIRGGTRKASVQFRLEKVSRRKDGQRFKLRIEVDQEQCTANVADLTPIFTNAICVLSKRKHHTIQSSTASSLSTVGTLADTNKLRNEPPIKLLKRDLNKIEEKLDDRMDAILSEIGRINRQIQLQNELIAKLFAPITSGTPLHTNPSSDTATWEWLLRSGLMDETTVHKSLPRSLPPTTKGMPNSMPYFPVSDDADDGGTTHATSPTSSDGSVVEIPSSTSSVSSMTFAEF